MSKVNQAFNGSRCRVAPVLVWFLFLILSAWLYSNEGRYIYPLIMIILGLESLLFFIIRKSLRRNNTKNQSICKKIRL